MPSVASTTTTNQDSKILNQIHQYEETISCLSSTTNKANRQALLQLRYEYSTYILDNLQHLTCKKQFLLNTALQTLRDLCKAGCSKSEFAFANILITGVPGSTTTHRPDYVRALPFYVSAAEKGHADAAYHAALCFETGRGCSSGSPDFDSAVEHHVRAAMEAHGGACYRLGMIYYNGELNRRRNKRLAMDWFQKAAKYADVKYSQAFWELATIYTRDPEYLSEKLALASLKRGAELHHVQCQLKLGSVYKHGLLSTRKDCRHSIRYYAAAAKQGSSEAIYRLALWNLTGATAEYSSSKIILEQRDSEAFELCQQAANSVEQPFPQSEYALGYLIENGLGIAADLEIAMEWYEIAAEHGDEAAMERLSNNITPHPLEIERAEIHELKEQGRCGKEDGDDNHGEIPFYYLKKKIAPSLHAKRSSSSFLRNAFRRLNRISLQK